MFVFSSVVGTPHPPNNSSHQTMKLDDHRHTGTHPTHLLEYYHKYSWSNEPTQERKSLPMWINARPQMAEVVDYFSPHMAQYRLLN